MLFNYEFYKYFEGYDKTKLESEINRLSQRDKDTLMKGYGYNSTKVTKGAYSIVITLKKRLSKKSLLKVFSFVDKNDLLCFLDSLSKEEKECLFKEYYLDNIEPKEDLSSSDKYNNFKTINKIKSKLGRSDKRPTKPLYKPYYDIFEGFSKEEVDHIFMYNTLEEKELIYKKYGRDFSNITFNKDVTIEDNYIINAKIFHTMKRRLKSLRNGVSCYVKITDLIDEDLDTIVSRSKNITNKSYYNKLVRYFGEDLSKEAFVLKSVRDNILNDKMKTILLGKEVPKYKKPSCGLIYLLRDARYLYERDEEFMERIKKNVDNLDSESQNLMYKKYGFNLDEIHDEKEYTKEEKYNIIHLCIPTIKYRLKNESKDSLVKPFFDRFSDYSRSVVLDGVSRLTDNEKALLKLVFGEDLNSTISVNDSNKKINKRINLIVKKVRSNIIIKLKEETGILVKYLKQIELLSRTSKYQEIERKYGSAVSLGIICYLYYKNEIDDNNLKRLTGLTYNDIKLLLASDINVLRKIK